MAREVCAGVNFDVSSAKRTRNARDPTCIRDTCMTCGSRFSIPLEFDVFASETIESLFDLHFVRKDVLGHLVGRKAPAHPSLAVSALIRDREVQPPHRPLALAAVDIGILHLLLRTVHDLVRN